MLHSFAIMSADVMPSADALVKPLRLAPELRECGSGCATSGPQCCCTRTGCRSDSRFARFSRAQVTRPSLTERGRRRRERREHAGRAQPDPRCVGWGLPSLRLTPRRSASASDARPDRAMSVQLCASMAARSRSQEDARRPWRVTERKIRCVFRGDEAAGTVEVPGHEIRRLGIRTRRLDQRPQSGAGAREGPRRWQTQPARNRLAWD